MLLPRRRVRPVEHNVRLRERRLDVTLAALADRDVNQDIGFVAGVDERRVRSHRQFRIENRRQGLIAYRQPVGRGGGDVRRLGQHQRDLVAGETNLVADPDEHRLVMLDQAEGVERHVAGGKHGDYAGHRRDGGHIDVQ